MSTDLKFFTNKEGTSLLERFKRTLAADTQFFDVLVGYFRSSGFYLLYPSLEQVEKIRVLVGLNLDYISYQIISQTNNSQLNLLTPSKNVVSGFEEQVINEVEESDDTDCVEEGVRKFIEFILNKKLEIRVYPEQAIHAKVYIIRKKEGHEDFGRVITGSSNFSQSGLVDNLEFNVELKDAPDVRFAIERFEELWIKGINVTERYVDTVREKTWLNDTVTPYELYLKFLYEYFREKINYDKEMFEDLPKGYLDLEYQKEAVADALLKIKEHNGVFLSDVVGLGKTYIAALLARKLGGRSLVICPPVLKPYWDDVMREFGIVAKVESHGKLDDILLKGVKLYDQVFIDEAHRFRNEITKSFETLHKICAGKKVILISATPLNNKSNDIANQLYLFQKKNNSTIPNIKNLKKFFNILEKKSDSNLSKEDYLNIMRQNSQEIRNKVLKYIMVRRTRAEVEKFYIDDMKNQGLQFPYVNEPIKLFYSFNDDLDSLFSDTLSIIRKISYSRYEPIKYLKTQTKDQDAQIQRVSQQNVRGFMKGLLVKRFESSFFAFKQTLKRFIKSYDKFIEMYDKGVIYVSKKIDVYDLLESEEEEELERLVEEGDVIKYDVSQFKEGYKEQLVADRGYLQSMLGRWDKIIEDPKLETFLQRLIDDDVLKNQKILIFTESKETGLYLEKNLKAKYPDKVLFASGNSSSSDLEEIRANFDPKHKKPQNKAKFLVTTDVLSEGINLHNANVIINYDIPWNSVRILQRVGRVNRVGTKHDKIFIYNFFPTSQAEREIGLEKLALAKIQAFHDTLGEDTKYLTGDEEFSSWELFSRVNSNSVLAGDDDKDIESELSYLKEIRDIRDTQVKLYEKIKLLPKKCRCARKKRENIQSLLTFFRRGSLKKFFKSTIHDAHEIDFFEAASIIKSNEKEIRVLLPKNYYELLSINKKAFEESIKAEKEEIIDKRGGGSENKLLKAIKALLKIPILTEDDEYYLLNLITALEEGSINKKSINSAVRKIKENTNPMELYTDIKRIIQPEYLDNLNKMEDKDLSRKKEIILSEALI